MGKERGGKHCVPRTNRSRDKQEPPDDAHISPKRLMQRLAAPLDNVSERAPRRLRGPLLNLLDYLEALATWLLAFEAKVRRFIFSEKALEPGTSSFIFPYFPGETKRLIKLM